MKLNFIAVRLQIICCILDYFRCSGLHDLLFSSCLAKLNGGYLRGAAMEGIYIGNMIIVCGDKLEYPQCSWLGVHVVVS